MSVEMNININDSQAENPDLPPTYEEATQEIPYDIQILVPPPSNNALRESVRQLKAESTGNVDLMRKVVAKVFCGVVYWVFLAIIIAVSVAMIVIGYLHYDDCKLDKNIPRWLIIGGVGLAIMSLISIIQRCCKNKETKEKEDEDDDKDYCGEKNIPWIYGCIILVIKIGCYWVYSSHQYYQSKDVDEDGYCNETVYMFAFWFYNAWFVLLGLLGFMVCCVGCLTAIYGGKK